MIELDEAAALTTAAREARDREAKAKAEAAVFAAVTQSPITAHDVQNAVSAIAGAGALQQGKCRVKSRRALVTLPQ